MEEYQIKNPQVKQLYNYNKNIYYDISKPTESRNRCYRKMNLIKGIAMIYELNETLDDEELEDILIAWNPILPEDIPKIKELLNKSKIEIGVKQICIK